MKQPVVLLGVGEMGGVFARGLLRLGHPVYPVTRDTDMARLAAELPEPAMVLVSVGEAELKPALDGIPAAWAGRLALLQNELLPADFEHLSDPTVISVWFEKKPGQDAKVIIPSPAYGPNAGLLHDALGAIGIPVKRLAGADDLLFELVVKNLYILTSNIAGLRVGGTVGELWQHHQHFAHQVAADVIALQEALTGHRFDQAELIAAMVVAFEGDPEHKCMGRSAPARLARAIEHADRLGLAAPTLRDIQAKDL
jgi:ketopantoate reductase